MIVLFFLELSIHILWWLFLNFWWFERSRFTVVFIFLSLSVCQLSLSTKKIFALIFQTQHSYLRYSKREVKYVYVIPFRIVCYTHKHEYKFKTVHQKIFLKNSREKLTIIALQYTRIKKGKKAIHEAFFLNLEVRLKSTLWG